MSIRKGFLAIAVTVTALLVAILYLMVLEAQNQRKLAAAEARHYASYKLSDELRQSSDGLTRMARTYTVTGDPVYKEHFHRILAIRNGEVPHPENYGGIYWDFVSATGEKPGPDGEPVALRTLIEHNLARDAFRVITATSGEQCLQLAHEIRPAAITLDVMMPVMDGFSFLAELRVRPERQNIPVIVLTAKDLTSDDRERLSGMVEQVLEKSPYTREQLRVHVRDAVVVCNVGRETEAGTHEEQNTADPRHYP